jgi:cellulose synthase operon protein YhjQ
MKTIALVSAVGGAGRTTFTAILAGLLAARGHPALAVECDPRNLLALHFGQAESAREGLAAYLLAAAGERMGAALRSDDEVLFVPWGEAGDTAPAAAAIDARLHAEPDWLRGLLARVDLPGNALALVDTPAWPSAHAAQAIAAADLVLVLLPPSPAACATLPRLRAALAGHPGDCAYVANAVLPARPLHTDILALLRRTLGTAMLPYQVHADAGVPEALARGENFCLGEPDSQAAHDLQGLASWLSRWAAGAGAGAPS